MKLTVSIVSAAIMLAFSMQASAHGCSGSGACQTINHKPSADARAGDQSQRQQQGQVAGSDNHTSISSGDKVRYLNVRPVIVPASPVVAPSSVVSRMVGAECGPRMKIVRRSVNAINNRPLSVQEFEAGTDEYTIADEDLPYKKVNLTPTIYQLIGHRVVETSAVVSTSTSGGIGVSAFGSSAGASVGGQSAGSIQRLITTIRLAECVAYEVDTKPYKLKG